MRDWWCECAEDNHELEGSDSDDLLGSWNDCGLGNGSGGAYWPQVYKKNSRFERARWASDLYRSFYQEENLKKVRDMLDCETGSEDVNKLVNNESSQFTDYLNFFEYIAFLKNAKQLQDSEVHDLFGYYLDCLRRHDSVLAYVCKSKNGYEGLARLIGNAVVMKELVGKYWLRNISFFTAR